MNRPDSYSRCEHCDGTGEGATVVDDQQQQEASLACEHCGGSGYNGRGRRWQRQLAKSHAQRARGSLLGAAKMLDGMPGLAHAKTSAALATIDDLLDGIQQDQTRDNLDELLEAVKNDG